MLTHPKTIWLTAAWAAVVVLVTGALAVGSLGPGPLTNPAGAPGLTVQNDEEEDQRVCPPTERNCSVEREEGENQPGNPGEQEGGSDGGEQVCTYGDGGGPILAADQRGDRPAIVRVAQGGRVVPCYINGRGWYDGTGCYYGPPAFNHDNTPPEGSTANEGQYYQVHCIYGFIGNAMLFDALLRHEWVEFADVPTVSPLELAQRAVASVGLDGVEFRLAPPETGAGLVGLPVWLGVARPGVDNTVWGPTSDLECDGGLCVQITAWVTKVEWDMGDGTVFTCPAGTHKVWQPGMDFLAPTGCHHIYHQSSRDLPGGRYPITATSTWFVEWETTSGGGQESDLETTRDSETSLQVDEIQVLTGS